MCRQNSQEIREYRRYMDEELLKFERRQKKSWPKLIFHTLLFVSLGTFTHLLESITHGMTMCHKRIQMMTLSLTMAVKKCLAQLMMRKRKRVMMIRRLSLMVMEIRAGNEPSRARLGSARCGSAHERAEPGSARPSNELADEAAVLGQQHNVLAIFTSFASSKINIYILCN